MFVRGHSSAPCYWNRPDKTAESMRGDWLYTGDRFIEKDGYYYFQGRADDLPFKIFQVALQVTKGLACSTR